MSHDPWLFDQPRNCASITMRQVLEGSEPILSVTHDADDHGWQFIGSTDANTDDGRVVGLGCIVDKDPSLLEVADLPPGWRAFRSRLGAPWQREKRPPDPDEES